MLRIAALFPTALVTGALFIGTFTCLTTGAHAAADRITVKTTPIAPFDKDSGRARFGALDYVGGFAFSSSDGRLKGVSAIRLKDGGRRFLALTDNGVWFAGRFKRDADGRLTGIDDAVLAPMLGSDGKAMTGKIAADAEALTIDGGDALVGFERDHRIMAFAHADAPFDSPGRTLPLPLPRNELRSNRGIEALAASPVTSPLHGAMVAVTERSLDAEGNLFAAIFDPKGGKGAKGSVFKVRKDDVWDVSDGTFLQDGDLLLLERRYQGPFRGLGIRLRRIAGSTIRPGALVDGPVIASFDLGQEIDNMEGIDAWIDRSGSTRLTMVSDDNGSFFQRSLILEFKLSNEPASTN